ncbi:tape measure protein [Pasteurella multocida]|uniref:tape measure protein n=1 Tax=Pasteurella multocida TaxID=747 RepID=UPI0023011856|nr:tape measure protein [Pasteurella multocida]MDA5609105.1 tape measure protein [Pasteurella multocida subsp. multocida]MDA5616650.1 tape measure protein [Pasteurella multocida]MDA5626645.1 tape measure protein [Pasteurella multocida]
MTDFAKLHLNVTSSGIDKADRDLAKLQNSAERAEKHIESLVKTIGRLKSLLAVGLGIQGISTIIQMTDKMTALNAQIKFVTSSTQEFNKVQHELFDIAQRTRGSLEATTTLYVRSSRALKDYGYSQKQVLGFTETLNKAMAVGGVGAQEQATALFQLSQALGSGRLQGDEFRSISEAAPIILDTIAEYMGKSRAEVKKLASEGKITSKIIFESISGASEKISESFEKMPLTFGQSMTLLQNSVLKWVSEINTSTGIIGGLATLVSTLALNFDSFAKAAIYATSAYAAFNVISLASNFKSANDGVGLLSFGFRSLTGAVRGATVAMLANPIGMLTVAIIGAAYAFDQFISGMEVGASTMNATWGDVALGVWEDFKTVVGDVADWFVLTWNDATDTLGDIFGGVVNTVISFGGTVLDYYKSLVNGILGAWNFGFDAIKIIWGNFPAVLTGYGKSAINGLLSIVESGINKVIDFLKTSIELLNLASKTFGGGDIVNTSGWKVDLNDFKLPETPIEKEIKDRLGAALTEAFSQDYIKDAIDGTFSYLAEAGDRYVSKQKALGSESVNLHKQNEALKTEISEKAAKERLKLLEKYMPEIKIRNELQKQLKEIEQLRSSGAISGNDAKYVSNKARWDSAYELADVAKEKAVSFEDRLKGTYDPAQDEMNKLQERLAFYKSFNEQKLLSDQELSERQKALWDEYNLNKKNQELDMYADSFSAMSSALMDTTELIGQAAGKQSGIYKAMFAASKAFAIAESIVKIQQGIANASALPWPQNLSAIASVISATSSIVSTISGTTMNLSGQAHSGIDNIPREGTWLLDKGERVVDSRTNQDLKKFLANQQKGSSNQGKPDIKVNIINNGEQVKAKADVKEKGGQLEVTVELIRQISKQVVNETIEDNFRQGGVFA